MRRLTLGLVLCVLFVSAFGILTGCARKSKAVTAKFPETGEGATAVCPPGGPGALGERRGGEVEEGEMGIPQSNLARTTLFNEAAKELQTIYFAFDSSALTPESRVKLETAATWMKQNPRVRVQIEGNCDERGTSEYNLALGERRALAARRYLISLGVDTDRIYTISYGEEKPAVQGHDEAAWKWNRRDDFRIAE
jgi:peptidoglycan-associated lipoprotein